MNHRTILEWETIRYGSAPDEIPPAIADRIADVAAASPLAGQGSRILDHGRDRLRARGVVGVIVAGDSVLEILPKIDFPDEDQSVAIGSIRRRLINMLAVAIDVKVDAGAAASLDWQNETLLEILIRIFAERLTEALRYGLPRRYIEQSDDLATLQGRLNVTRQFTNFAANPTRLACEYEALTTDIALNQIMKATVAKLARSSRSAMNQRQLRELTFVFDEIADIPAQSLRWDHVVLDRTSARWRELVSLARLLLGDRFQTTSAGKSKGFSLLFEMNTLFEEYIARILQKALIGTGHVSTNQGGRLYCLQTQDGRGLFQTKPDILIKSNNRVVQIIDTKWKRISGRLENVKQGISQADVYQMMAYGQLYGSDRLTLLYPHHSMLNDAEGLHAIHLIRGTNKVLELATIDISHGRQIAERLRALVAGIPRADYPSAPTNIHI
ncbi:restriction endonuclease [Agrobacterium rhizogenes]|nr:restriction endonuclease [Rhizobium rhizogenes]NTI96347.1 restriction endonuclease [Rhizobium rhizogenes]NTJ61073.1 restriction endonuclease [Rhizobium rhizogenes]OCJ23836.1 restriction endonuclease [Agrobacterium sp. B133/95]